jgi:hypothetical protein
MRIPQAIDHPLPLGPVLTDVTLFIFSGSHLGDDLMNEIYLLHATHPNNQSMQVKHELTRMNTNYRCSGSRVGCDLPLQLKLARSPDSQAPRVECRSGSGNAVSRRNELPKN